MAGYPVVQEALTVDNTAAKSMRQRALTVDNMNLASKEMRYAVRGEVVTKANEIKERLAQGEALPFKSLVPCNIGNPHAVKQKPITFYRQVAACCLCPSLIDGDESGFPADVKARAKEYLDATAGNGVGAYTDSVGLNFIRKQVCDFIERRDGFPAKAEDIELTTGASEGIKRCLAAIISTEKDGILIPRPQYPLYTASITMFGGKAVFYDLDEKAGWKVTRRSLDIALRGFNGTMRAITVINPGNPSGSVLDEQDIEMIIDFCHQHVIVILADEVYQENIYAEGKKFHSFKKVLRSMQKKDEKYKTIQLLSFHSTSKGLIGECGQRGGYMEMNGFSANFHAQMTKVAATSLSSNTIGQIFVGLMVTPPKEGDPSYPLFKQEADGIFEGMRRRAGLLSKGLNEIPGIHSQAIEGAMYAFPKVSISMKAQEAAKEEGIAADDFWCLRLVEECGIVCVPGSGFGQEQNTFHFRITILPPDDMLEGMLVRLKKFQEDFMAKYKD